ncbi:MAG: methionine aminotransferase [Bacteroidota bacterium]
MSNLPHIGTTIFSVMSQLANEHNAINLSQGFPNFDVDPELTAILQRKAIENVHQYAPMAGNPILLNKISRLVEQQYSRTVQPDTELLVTAGATQAIFASIQALVSVGDEVIILDPSYDCYEPPILLAGAVPLRIPLQDDFLPNWDLINKAVNKKTKLLIINNPHNPSGRIWSESDFLALEHLMENHPNLLLLSDEVYEFITFEKKHISINERPSIYDRAIIVSSFGKTFHITGWKVGYLVAPKNLMMEIKKVHQFLVFSVNSIAQATLAEYLEKVNVNVLGGFYQQKRDFFAKQLVKSRFKLLPSEGSYFQVASFEGISNESDVTFTTRMVQEFGVAAIPISVFNADNRDLKLIRFCFAKDDETLINAGERLCRI